METCHDCESLPMHAQHRGQATINERYSLGSPTTSCRKADSVLAGDLGSALNDGLFHEWSIGIKMGPML